MRMNEKEQIIRLDYYPSITEEEIRSNDYMKVPFAELEALGVAFGSLPNAFRTATQNVQVAGLFQAKIPVGTHMVAANNGSGLLGACFDSGNHLVGQARFTPVDTVQQVTTLPYNPSMIFVAAMLMRIEHKLDSIQETQSRIIGFLNNDKASKLEGDLKTLTALANEYKYNWDSETYRINKHKEAGDIKRSARQKILFYRKEIADLLNKHEPIKKSSMIEKRVKEVHRNLMYYRLAVYVFAFSSFLEALFLDKRSSEYLYSVASEIEELSYEYRLFYTDVYNKLEKLVDTTVESYVLDGTANVSKNVGHAMAKVPLVKKTPLDDSLIKAGRKLDKLNDKKSDELMDIFKGSRSSGVKQFVDGVREMDDIFNKPKLMLIDDEAVYLKTY